MVLHNGNGTETARIEEEIRRTHKKKWKKKRKKKWIKNGRKKWIKNGGKMAEKMVAEENNARGKEKPLDEVI